MIEIRGGSFTSLQIDEEVPLLVSEMRKSNLHVFSGYMRFNFQQSDKKLELFPETLVSLLNGTLGGLETLEVFFCCRSLGVNIF